MSNHRINQRITRSSKFYQVSWKSQLTYLLQFAFLDDFGVWTADPHEIWRELFVDHKSIREKDIPDILEELAEVKLIKLYAIGGKLYQQYENFNIFQSFGQGYNKKSSYPTFEECDIDPEHNESNSCNWVYSGVKGCLRVFLGVGSNSLSLSNSHSNSPSNTNSNSPTVHFNYYREEDITKLDVEEKEVLKCFYSIKYKLRKEYLKSWNDWIGELKKDYKDKNLLTNAKKWRDYFEQKPPKNHKSSFRNWISKDYADKQVYNIDNNKFYKELLVWGEERNNPKEDKYYKPLDEKIFMSWLQKYGEGVIKGIMDSCKEEDDRFNKFLVAMGELKENKKNG